MDEVGVRITVNGTVDERRVPARLTLADYLREERRLTGTHLGCEHGVCGACTVLVDGRSVRSCIMLAAQADGRDVRTVEGLAGDGPLTPLQQALSEEGGLQCGFCTPGFLMAATELLQRPGVDEEDVREALSGNLCRCTGYDGIVRAVLSQVGDGSPPRREWPDTGPEPGSGVPGAPPVRGATPPVTAVAQRARAAVREVPLAREWQDGVVVAAALTFAISLADRLRRMRRRGEGRRRR